MTDEFILTLTHATERDIDLLLVEEFYSSIHFASWMMKQVGIEGTVAKTKVLHSKRRTQSRREIDIFIDVTMSDGRRNALLVENKIDATEQPDQAESYREEVEQHSSGFDRAAIAIVCPSAYAAQHSVFTSKFDATVTYEAIADFFLERVKLEEIASTEQRLRYVYRAEILDQAVEKHRRGYTPVPDKSIGDFNAEYVALLARSAPEIIAGPSMLKPANPRGSSSMIFDHNRSLGELPSSIRPRRFVHELSQGHRTTHYAAVTFAAWGELLTLIPERLKGETAPLGASFAAKKPTSIRPNPGLVMSLPTSTVDNQGDFAVQTTAIADGIATAVKLREWLIINQEVLHGWHRVLTERESSR